MPRRPRIKLAGILQHVLQRGINREPCFFVEEDYPSYLHWLEKRLPIGAVLSMPMYS